MPVQKPKRLVINSPEYKKKWTPELRAAQAERMRGNTLANKSPKLRKLKDDS